MEAVLILSIVLYMFSTVGYCAYLFLQKDYLQRLGFFVLLVGFICHTVLIVYGSIQAGHMPVSNLRETLFFAGWAVAGVFLILHYKATERDDSELWNYCRNMEIPESLQRKLELYQSASRIDRDNHELFGQDSWLAVLDGQHVKARSYSPLVDTMPDDMLEQVLRQTREVIEKCVTAMPPHEEFISRHCAAMQEMD